MGRTKSTENGIDWLATFAANSETETTETVPTNYYLDDKAIEEFRTDRGELKDHTFTNYAKEISFTIVIDNISGCHCLTLIHSHIQRCIFSIRKSSLCCI